MTKVMKVMTKVMILVLKLDLERVKMKQHACQMSTSEVI